MKTTRLNKVTSMENLQMEVSGSYGCVLKYGDHVIATDCHWKGGFQVDIYEFIETPEETGLGDIECRIGHIARAEKRFEDGGHAVAWALTFLAAK